jgi:TetR/AcrR family transcriptional regulator, cholesterol catabolism regulator
VKKAVRPEAKTRSTHLEEKARKKAAILGKAAARLFNEKGYIETSLEDITAAAKVSKGAIYHYFSSKSELLFFILNDYMDIILDGLEEDLSAIPEPLDKIRYIIRRHIGFYCDHTALAKTLMHDAHCLPTKYFKSIAKKEQAYFQMVASALATIFEGNISKERLTVLTFTLFGMCNWIYVWYNPKGPVTPQGLADIVTDTFLHGVIVSEKRPECPSTEQE